MKLAIFLLTCMSVVAPAAETTDYEKIQGTWQVEQFTENGGNGEIPPGLVAIIEGNTFQVQLGDLSEPKATFTLDSSRNPKAIDFIDGQGRVVSRGIYDIGDGRLRLCYSRGQRPETFTSARDARVRLAILRRK